MEWKKEIAEWAMVILQAMVPVILAVISASLPKLFAWLEQKTSAGWLDKLIILAGEIAQAKWETIAKGVKQDYADGNISEAEMKARLAQAKQEAINGVVEFIRRAPKAVQPILMPMVSDIIESAIGKRKVMGLMSLPQPAPLVTVSYSDPQSQGGNSQPSGAIPE